jgi:hypothetical protein
MLTVFIGIKIDVITPRDMNFLPKVWSGSQNKWRFLM